MEKNEILWKKAEQSFVDAYDFAVSVVNGKINLTQSEKSRLSGLLKLWLEALAGMKEHASDVEMAQDFQAYFEKLNEVLKHFA